MFNSDNIIYIGQESNTSSGPKDMYKERNFVNIVTELEVHFPWCLAGLTSMKNKSKKM